MPKKIILDEQEIIAHYKSGDKSCKDISKLFFVSKNTICSILKRNNIPLTNRYLLISKKTKGRPSIRKGVKLSIEQCRQTSERMKGHKYNIGSKRSDESKRLMSEKRKLYIQRNPDKFKKTIVRLHEKAKRDTPDVRLLKRRARGRYKNLLRRVCSLNKYIKNDNTHKLLNYSFKEFKEHIESTFDDNMCWNNRVSFEIDHIVPVAEFFRRGVTNPCFVNALNNLTAITPFDNKKKSDTYDSESFGKDIFNIIADMNIREVKRTGKPFYELA